MIPKFPLSSSPSEFYTFKAKEKLAENEKRVPEKKGCRIGGEAKHGRCRRRSRNVVRRRVEYNSAAVRIRASPPQRREAPPSAFWWGRVRKGTPWSSN